MLPRADGLYQILTVEQHTLTIDVNGVRNTIPIAYATPSACHKTNIHVGHGRKSIGGEREFIQNEYQSPVSVVAQNERNYNNETNKHPAPGVNENINAHTPRNSKHPDVNESEVDLREYAATAIVGRMQKIGRTHYVV